MNDSGELARQQAWSSYWAGGALHSCAESFHGNYSGTIAEFWKSRFEPLSAGSRVLDLATGNGALPLMLWEYTRAKGQVVRTDAVDLAQVAPAWYLPALHQDIEFHSGVAMEQLPFADSTFDLVVSQFGLEYAHWPQALQELLRVSKPAGSAAFFMHHPASIIVQVGREELKNIESVLSPDGLLDAARGVMPWIAHARAGSGALVRDPEAAASRQAYNSAAQLLGIQIDASPVPDLLLEVRASVHALLTGITAGGCGPQVAQLEVLGHTLRAAALRAAELVEHAVDQRRLGDMVEVFQAARPMHSVTCEPLSQKEGILGWSILVQPQPP